MYISKKELIEEILEYNPPHGLPYGKYEDEKLIWDVALLKTLTVDNLKYLLHHVRDVKCQNIY